MTNKKYLDIEVARAAVEKFDSLGKDNMFMDDLLPALPKKVMWVLVEHKEGDVESWKFHGCFCGVPFYNINVFLEDGKKMYLSFEEVD